VIVARIVLSFECNNNSYSIQSIASHRFRQRYHDLHVCPSGVNTATCDSPVLVTHNIPIEIAAETPSSLIGNPVCYSIGEQAFTLKSSDAMHRPSFECNSYSTQSIDYSTVITISMYVRAVLGCLLFGEAPRTVQRRSGVACWTRNPRLASFVPSPLSTKYNTTPRTAAYDSPVLVTRNIPIEIVAETPSSFIGNPICYSIGEQAFTLK